MTSTTSTPPTATTRELRPRYEGANIGTWIGFKHVNYLVEEAVLDHLARCGYPAGALYERYGLCVELVDMDTKIRTALHVDDVVTAVVVPEPDAADELVFRVRLDVRGETPVKAVRARVRVRLRRDRRAGPAEATPAALEQYTVDSLRDVPAGYIRAAGGNTFTWRLRIPYFYCHFTERIQLSGYLRLLEETVDRFLADRGVSIRTLLDGQNWIPVVPRSRVELLDEALLEEELHVVFTVDEVFKRLTYTATMDCFVVRDGREVPTATGSITHGYALIGTRRDWAVVGFDDRLLAALSQTPGR
ncbi:hypothetical protein [Amycolatopsis samaneae]|uniref:Acyl-CoA thioesterase FadM n=1 Tax=Amycolatopsis samaneae TaxID=664691 RepID=A0ABW5GP27_9PSEU